MKVGDRVEIRAVDSVVEELHGLKGVVISFDPNAMFNNCFTVKLDKPVEREYWSTIYVLHCKREQLELVPGLNVTLERS